MVLVIEFTCYDQLDQFGFVYILQTLGQSQLFDSLDLVIRLSLVPVRDCIITRYCIQSSDVDYDLLLLDIIYIVLI